MNIQIRFLEACISLGLINTIALLFIERRGLMHIPDWYLHGATGLLLSIVAVLVAMTVYYVPRE